MNDYIVTMTPRAYHDLDEIYNYIVENFKESDTARAIIGELEKAVIGLNIMPARGSIRKAGIYANKNYRQIFIKNFTIVYRIDQSLKEVIVVAIRYTPSNF